MKPSRITAMHVHIGGVVILLVVAIVLYFGMIRPKKLDTETQRAAADAAEKGGGTLADNQSSAAGVVKAKKDTVQITKDWAIYQRRYMPELNWGNNLLVQFYLHNPVNEIPAQWGHWITAWYDAQKKDGVTRDPGVEFAIPPLASDPNGIASLTSITLPTAKSPWKVSLTCQTFDDAMAHLRRFNSMTGHGMPVVDDVTLSGHSPQLTLSYNLLMYIIPGHAPPPVDPRIGAGSGSGGGQSGFGGAGGFSSGMKQQMQVQGVNPGGGGTPGAAKGPK